MKKEFILFVSILVLVNWILPLSSQTVERKVGKYILIDTDLHLGAIKDTLYVMRVVNDKKKEVGKAVIVKFNQGKTAAILKEGLARPGDRVSKLSSKQIQSIRQSFDTTQESYYNILKIFKGYALIGPNSPFTKNNQTLVVKRNTQFGYIDVGSVKVVKTQNGNTAARIINEIAPYKIKKGDVVLGKMVSSDKNVIDVLGGDLGEDIDYYFFGPYNP